MIDPTERSLHRFDHRQTGGLSALDHNHLDAKLPCGLDLAVGRVTAAVLGDDDLDLMLSQHVKLVGQAKRTPAVNVADMRHRQRRLDGIDAADPIMVLRRGVRLMRLLTAGCKEDTQGLGAKCSDSLRNAVHGKPVIASDRHPCGTAQRESGHMALSSSRCGIGRDAGCKRMRGIYQQVDLFVADIAGKPLSAAETAAAHRNGLGRRIGGSSGKRQDDLEIRSRGKSRRQRSGLGRAAEDQNAGLAHG